MKPVKLGVFTINERHLRFCMIDRNGRIYNSNNIHMTGCHPLFLGSDILCGTSEWNKNMCRIHARFAKQGLATKLVFRDCRIDGLRKGDEAYFYSVFGLFRAVFEYHPFSVQRQCLQLLTDVWMKTSVESPPRLKVKYEVSLQTLHLAQDLPPAAADGEDDDKTEDNASVPPRHSKIPHAAKLPVNRPSQQISSDSAPARLRNSESLRETSCTSAVQDSGTQTDLSFSTAGTSPESVVVLETVCKMCRTRQKRAGREKAEVDSGVGLSKKPRPELVERGEKIHQVGMRVECSVEEAAVVSGTKSGFVVKNVGVRSADGCFSRRPPSPSSVTSFRSVSPVRLSGESDSKIRTGFSSSSSRCDTQESHVYTQATSDTGDSVSGLNQSTRHHRSHTLPRQTFRETAQCSKISNREVSIDGVQHDLGLAQAQKGLCHVQTQTCQIVFNPATHSFSEVDSLSVLNRVKTCIDDDSVGPVTLPDSCCLEPNIGLENSVRLLTDAAENDLQVLTNTAENDVEVLTDTAENNLQVLTNTAENNVNVLTDTAENNLQVLMDTAENNVHVLTDTAENSVHVLTDIAENNIQVLTNTAENNVQVLTNTAENNVQVLTDTAENNVHVLIDAVPYSINEFPAEKIEDHVFQRGIADVAECVQNWIKQVRKLKLLLETEDTTKRARDSFDDAVPDSAKRAPHLECVPDSAKRAALVGAVPDSAKRAPHQGAVPDSSRRAPHLHSISRLEILQLILEFFLPIVDAVGDTTSSDVSIVSEILTLILNAAENSAEFASASPEWPVTSPLKLSVLTMVGTWLGEEFRRFKPAIFQKVTAFKQKHINNIGGLPSAVEIIAELFPSCMAQFVGAWIGLADLQHAEAMEMDHCYQSGSGTSSAQQQNRSQFPLIQLVLELLNNSLVSGIAHVVFCKL